jgi:hypothetical protein
MKLYAYCLAEGIDVLEQPVLGISNAPVHVLKTETLSVLVSDVNDEPLPVTRENALAHAAVVRSILDRTTPLPFRFGTIVTEQQLRNYLAAKKPAIETKLAQVRGCVEMSVKIIWENKSPKTSDTDEDSNSGPGTSFLAEKRREILGDERRAAEVEKIAGWLHEQVADFIRSEQVTLRPEASLVLAAAHLVERAHIPQYREKVAEARQKRPELHFLFSGPWPPYSFANIELEFKSQFGVS